MPREPARARARAPPEVLTRSQGGPVDLPAASQLRSPASAPLPPAAPASPATSSAYMNERSRTAGPEAQTTMVNSFLGEHTIGMYNITMVNSAAVKFKLNYDQTKNLAPGKAIHSDPILAGGHMWRINWYPGGVDDESSKRGVGMMVELMSVSRTVEAMVAVSLMKCDKSSSVAKSTWSFSHVFETDGDESGWFPMMQKTDLLNYVIDGNITAYCTIMVLHDSSIIPAPPSDLGRHLGSLLDSTDGADVSFVVEGETFHVHRAVLAARSPVFRAELLGSMSEASMPSITLHDITPATFRIMLRFMYTDVFPRDDELGDSPTEMFKHLLAAADRYVLDRLKNMCAQKLWENVSVDTVSDALACAETYSCPELKNKCIEFVVAEENFKKAVLTESFMQLWLKFPSIVAELRERVGK